MRILHIIPNLKKGGAERLVLDICIALSKTKDVEVRLITFSDENDYRYLSKDIDWRVIPSEIELSVWRKNKICTESLQKLITDFKPDIIHSHLFEAEIISRTCNYPQAKWFSHCHDNMIQFQNFSLLTILRKRDFLNFYEKRFLFKRYKKNGGNHFIAISNDTKRFFDKTASPYPVTLLPNSIDYRRFYTAKTINKIGSRMRLINTGSFVDKKNQKFIVEVASVLKRRGVDFELHLLGDGPNRKKIEAQISNLQLEKEVILHGNVDNVEVYLWQSDIYIHSATYEPMGLVLIEAMASGLPIISLDGKGNRDLIENEKNGYMLFEPNIEKFTDKICEVWFDKDKLAEESSYAQQFARRFDLGNYTIRLKKIYMQ